MSEEIDAIENLNTSQTYAYDDPFSKALAEFESIQICDGGLNWCREQNALYPDATYGEILTNLINDENQPAGWAMGIIGVFMPDGLLDADLFEGYVQKVINHGDPMKAFRLLRWQFNNLSPKQKNDLRKKYKDVLANIDLNL